MPDTLISDEQMLELLESVWTSMLELPIRPAAMDGPAVGSARLMASVHISGQWNGTVLLQLTERFARRAAGTMLAVADDQLAEDDLHDAAAELCNIVGGSIKSLLPGRNALSLPCVVEGADFLVRIPRTRLLSSLDVVCEGQPLNVRVLEAIGS